MSALNIEGAKAKIGRAWEHRNDLDDEISSWVDSKPCVVTRESNAEHTRWAFKVESLRKPDDLRFGLMFGDAIHNTRSALDHLFFSIATKYVNGPNANPEDWSFPIGRDAGALGGKRGKIQGIPDTVWAAIMREQPHARSDEGDSFSAALMLSLSGLDNCDKHRKLSVVLSVARSVEWLNLEDMCKHKIPFEATVNWKWHQVVGENSADKGEEVATVTTSEPCRAMNPEFRLTFSVALAETPNEVGTLTAIEFLDCLISHADNVIDRVSATVV